MKQKLLLILSCSLSLMNAMEMAPLLPADTARDICCYGTETLNDAGKLISTFTQTCKIFKASFNDSNHCLCLIKKLSDRFNCSNEEVAETLQIQSARNRLYLQKTLLSYCKRFAHPYSDTSILKSRFARLKRDNVDFNFTYGNCNYTGLMQALSPADPEPETARYLILNGADLHIEDTNGFSGHSRIFASHPYLIPFLVEHKKLEPNKKNGLHGKTPLINLLLGLTSLGHSQQDIQTIENGMITLLEAGADPELADKDGHQPVRFAYRQIAKCPQFMTLLEKATAKKYASTK